MSLAVHILITVSIVAIGTICLEVSDFFNYKSINEELTEIKPLLSEDMYKRVRDDAQSGHGVFARCVTEKLSIKDMVLIPIIGLCSFAIGPALISTFFNMSWEDTLVVVFFWTFIFLDWVTSD